MTQNAWNIYLRGELLDTVFYNSDCDEDYVLRGLIEHDGFDPDIEVRLRDKDTDPEFFCRPVKAYAENPDGSPAEVNECDLAEAQWVGVYRTNPDHETTDKDPTEWVLDLPIDGNRDYVLRLAEGLCELLNGITPAEALHNPNLHIFFE